MKKYHLLHLIIFSLLNGMIHGQSSVEVEQKIKSLLSKMTLEEKVGQMNQYNGFYDATGPAPAEGNAQTKYEHLKKGWVGSMLNVRGVEEIRKLQEIVVKESRLGIPMLFGSDVIHGFKTLAPIPLAEAASWDLEAIKESACMAASEASSTGINWTFAPMIDIYRDPRWGRVMEGAGEDTFLGTEIAKARIEGFQGEDLKANNTIAATAKHFAGYGFSESGREYNTTNIDDYTLHNVVLPPFKAAIESNVQTVMNSFGLYNGIPATGSKKLQRDLLKGKWNFQGFVISDWGSIMEMTYHGFSEDLKDAAKRAAIAGSDVDMESYAYVNHLVDLVKSGGISEALIDDAVTRVLRVKFNLGLFDDPYRYCDEEREKELLYNEAHQKTALEMAKKSMVLLKNDTKLLPLNTAKKIGIIGDLANDKTSPLGSWRIGSDDGTAVSVLEGFDKAGISYQYAKGCNVLNGGKVEFTQELTINTTNTDGFEEAKELASKVDTVIMVLGEHGFQSGEGRSRTELGLPEVQQQLLEEIYAINQNIVLVLLNGRPLVIPWAAEHIPTILEAWQPGSQTGNAITEVLTGKYNPSGKLPMTFPRSVGQIPIYYNNFSTGRPYKKPDVFWSHYTDEENTPQFPFGYGLSYTEFEYNNLNVEVSNGSVIASIAVKNVGDYDGEEVVQLYIQDIAGTYARPVKELKGFQKIFLKQGETKKVSFVLTKEHLGYYTAKGEFICEAGDFNIMIGTSSEAVSSQKIRVDKF